MDRMLRVNELLKREIGEVFEVLVRGRVSGLVTVTDIRTSADLRSAIVYVSMYGSNDEAKAKLMHVLAQERAEIQRRIARHVKLKYTPILEFRLDDHLGQADHMFQLLDKLEQEETDDQQS